MFALVLAAALSAQAPAPGCVTVPAAIASAETAGGYMINMIEVDGEVIDHLLFVAVNGTIQMWGVREGCMIGPTLSIDNVKGHGQPA